MICRFSFICKPITVCSRKISSTGCMRSGEGAIGFVGLGNMGGHMANNLLKNKLKVLAYDVNESALSCFSEKGGFIAKSPAEVANKCSTIITMLPESSHSQQVYLGDEGILSAVQKNALLIDSSTIEPTVSQELAQKAEEGKASYLDAPVSGGVLGARDGNLTFMVGGKRFKDAETILLHMGKNVIHCGDVGTGQAAKICNNMMLAICMIGTSETINLGIKLGLDPKLLSQILNTSTGRSWSSEVYNPCPGILPDVPSSNNYEGGFPTALMAKDLAIANTAASKAKFPIPLGALCHQLYRLMMQSGFAKKDFSYMFKFLQGNN